MCCWRLCAIRLCSFFALEDWVLLMLRAEFHLMVHSFKKDVRDVEKLLAFARQLWGYTSNNFGFRCIQYKHRSCKDDEFLPSPCPWRMSLIQRGLEFMWKMYPTTTTSTSERLSKWSSQTPFPWNDERDYTSNIDVHIVEWKSQLENHIDNQCRIPGSSLWIWKQREGGGVAQGVLWDQGFFG